MSSRRRLALFGLLAASLAAAVWVSDAPGGTDDVVAATADRATAPRNNASGLEQKKEEQLALLVDNLQRAPMAVGDLNPFGARSWYVAPPPPPPAPPPKPTAPPLPFAYVGKLKEDGGRWVIYLAKGEQSFAVSKGDTFDNDYRLEGIEDGTLIIVYLPLSIKQMLPIGSES